MITYLSLYLLLNILVIFSNHINPIHCQSNNNGNQEPGRVFSGCALTNNNKIYCFGGYTGSSTDNGIYYQNPLNDHIELDLTAIGNFSAIDKSKIQWESKSNTVNGTPLGRVAQIATAPLSDGSYLTFGGRAPADNNQPFAVYHPQSDQWNGIPLFNNTFYTETQIVNLGNDQIWIWGGLIPAVLPSSTLNMLFIYDYKSGLWRTAQPFTGRVAKDHTATLVNNIIYIIGGGYIDGSSSTMNTFSTFQTYNTIDGTWANLTTNSSKPDNRIFHTTVATADNKYLIIYGGSRPLNNGYESCDDPYYIYDIERNSLQGVNITNLPGSSGSQRFGHYATIYNSNYLLLIFGYRDMNTPTTENLNVLNIQNPYQPNWVQFATNTNNSSQPIDGGNKGVDIKTIVPAVVVPVVVVLSAAAVALFLFIRHRKRKQKKQFILEQEDPRKLFDTENNNLDVNNNHNNNNNNTGDLFADGTTVVRSEPSDGGNSLIIHQNQQAESSETPDNHHHLNTVKPSESIDVIKPSE